MKISMIVAVAENGAIGKDNQMLWHIPEDFKYFKEKTMGKPMIMGRKTFESIGRPLPGRLNIVVTRDVNWSHEDVITCLDLEEALTKATDDATQKGKDEVMIVGGAQIYARLLERAQRLYYTEVHQSYDCDATFPRLDKSVWQEISREDHTNADNNKPDYSFVVYERA